MNRQLFNAMITAQYKKKTLTSINNSVKWSDEVRCYLPSLKIYGQSQYTGESNPHPSCSNVIADDEGLIVECVFQDSDGVTRYFRVPTPLLSVYDWKETIRDEWDYVTGKGVRRIRKIVLDGVTNKITQWDQDAKIGFIDISENPIKASGDRYIMSSHFFIREENSHGSIYAKQKDTIALVNTDLSSLEEWNNWLKQKYDEKNPVVVYYVLENPIPFEERPSPFYPISNESGMVGMDIDVVSGRPIEITYVTYPIALNLLKFEDREIVDFGANPNTTQRSFTGNGIIVGVARNNYYRPTNVTNFEKDNTGFDLTVISEQASYGIGFDLKVLPNTTYVCSFDEIKNHGGNAVELAEYDENGNWLSAVYPTRSADGESRLLTTSANAVWGVFIFRNNNDTPRRYSNVSIRKE